MATKQNTIVLFDVDGTLTPARREISSEMKQLLVDLRSKVTIGFVGGSDLNKVFQIIIQQKEQLGEGVIDMFDFCFSENGLTAYKNGEQLASQSFIGWLGQPKYNKMVNFILRYIADLDLPVKRHVLVNLVVHLLNSEMV